MLVSTPVAPSAGAVRRAGGGRLSAAPAVPASRPVSWASVSMEPSPERARKRTWALAPMSEGTGTWRVPPSRPSPLTGMRVPSSKLRNTSRSKISWPAGGVAVTEMLSVSGAVSARSAVTVATLLSDTPVFTACPPYPVTRGFESTVHCSPWTAPVIVVGPTHTTSIEYGELLT